MIAKISNITDTTKSFNPAGAPYMQNKMNNAREKGKYSVLISEWIQKREKKKGMKTIAPAGFDPATSGL